MNQMLAPHLQKLGVTCHPTLFGKKLKHDNPEAPGGIFKYDPVYKHINAALRQYSSANSYVTTMVDFYAFPQDFPAYLELAQEIDSLRRVVSFEEAMFNQMMREERFIPYIQLHEFEALIFSRLEALRTEFEDAKDLKGLDRLIASMSGMKPEEINQTKTGAPSKRLNAHLRFD